jgi:HSP20 family molecular chaperone IbpA
VDITETDKACEITAELPGMDEKNIEVKFADGVLTIKGEKKDEKEEKRRITISASAATAPFSARSRFPMALIPTRSRQPSKTAS